jgi:hypothetical protein
MYLSPLKNIKARLKQQVIMSFESTYLTIIISLIFLFFSVSPQHAFAETVKEDVIAKIASAYDAKALLNMKAITIADYRKNVFSKQSSPTALPDLWRFNEELTIDFANKKKALVSWRVNSTNKDLEKYIVDEKSARVYDILHRKYSDDDWYNLANTGGSVERSSDTLIAKKLLSTNSTFRVIDEVQYQGQAHYQIAFVVSGQSESHIYINKKSGLINKVFRTHPTLGTLTYLFSNHSKVGNISFARDMDFSIGDNPRTISTYRNIELNPNLSNKFAVPQGVSSWGVPLDVANMLYNKLGNHVYHVGKNFSRTLFIDAGEYFISVGGNDAIKEHFTSLQHRLNTKKPLKFAVLTHHHSSQLNMLEPALKLGAKIITVASNLTAIKRKLNRELNENNVVLVNQSKELIGGNLKIFDIATAHADHNLVVYLEKEKILFAEDHYETLYKKGNPRSFKNMLIFAYKIEKLSLDVRTLIDSSSPRVLSIDEFKNTIDTYTSPICPKGYRVCQGG